jgi:hypothetical protein
MLMLILILGGWRRVWNGMRQELLLERSNLNLGVGTRKSSGSQSTISAHDVCIGSNCPSSILSFGSVSIITAPAGVFFESRA